VGDPQTPSLIPWKDGHQLYQGEPVYTRLDEKPLQEIARLTKGTYTPAQARPLPLGDVLREPPLVVDTHASLADALRLMREQRRGYVLVVEDEKLTGIFTERDVLMKVAGTQLNVERTRSAHA